MAKFYIPKISFASGELSPALAARSDLAAYSIGAREMTNLIVLPQGGFINRPGTAVAASGNAFEGARLIPFVSGVNASYCLVFRTDNKADVYRPDGTFVTSITGVPYAADELGGLKTLQSIDLMYIFCKTKPVYKIKRFGDTNWQFQAVNFKNGPYEDINTGDMTMALSGNALTASAAFFTADMVGRRVKLEAAVKPASGDFTLNESSAQFMIFGAGTIETRGNWDGTVYVYRREPDETNFPAMPYRTWAGDRVNNSGLSVNEQEYGVYYKVTETGGTVESNESGSVDYRSVRVTYSSGGGIINRQLIITAVTNSTQATVANAGESGPNAPATVDWAMGAFGGASGYPAVGIFHQERLVLANTADAPQTMWMSKSASWEDFGTSIPVLDTDAITITLAARQRNDILGFSSRDDLLIFTSGAEWTASAGQKTDVLTPSSVKLSPSTYRGSFGLEPMDIGEATMFVQEYGRVVRSMGYQLDIDGYGSSEVSILSGHLTEGTYIKRWAYQQDPWSVIWMALGNGEVLALTVQQEHGVNAWTRQIFNGPVRDIACVPGQEQDEMFMIIGADAAAGKTARLVRLSHRKDRAGTFTAADYMDDREDVYVCAFEAMELEADAGGSMQGKHKHISGASCIRVFRTTAMKAGVVTENSGKLDVVLNQDIPYTGDIYPRLPGGVGKKGRVRIANDMSAPGPLCVLGVYQDVTVNEG
jgi:hypothetical protein